MYTISPSSDMFFTQVSIHSHNSFRSIDETGKESLAQSQQSQPLKYQRLKDIWCKSDLYTEESTSSLGHLQNKSLLPLAVFPPPWLEISWTLPKKRIKRCKCSNFEWREDKLRISKECEAIPESDKSQRTRGFELAIWERSGRYFGALLRSVLLRNISRNDTFILQDLKRRFFWSKTELFLRLKYGTGK